MKMNGIDRKLGDPESYQLQFISSPTRCLTSLPIEFLSSPPPPRKILDWMPQSFGGDVLMCSVPSYWVKLLIGNWVRVRVRVRVRVDRLLVENE